MHKSKRELMVKFLMELPFVHHLKNFEHQDKIELVNRFELKTVKRGERLFEKDDQFNCMYLVINGLLGIFYNDQTALTTIIGGKEYKVNLPVNAGNIN